MNDGWQRPGGPPEITFEIPLEQDEWAPPEPSSPPRGRAALAVGGAVVLAVAAIAIVAAAGTEESATPTTTSPTTVPPTIPPVEPPATAPATVPRPTFPLSVGMPTIVLDQFDLGEMLAERAPDTPIRGVTTLTSPSLGEIEIEMIRDVASQRDQMTVREEGATYVAIYDRSTGDTYHTGPEVPADRWIRQPPDGNEPTPQMQDSLLFGPVRSDTIDQAVQIESGPIVVVAMAGRATGPPIRVFHVTFPASALADSLFDGFGLVDATAPDQPDIVLAVHASERLGIELVAASVIRRGEEATFRHHTELLAEPSTITLPDPAIVIDADDL